MQETFEHKISQQLDDFKLQPSPIVWQEVDAALHPERKRRFIIWWWLGAAVIGICLIGYWFIDHQNTANSIREIASKDEAIIKNELQTKNISPNEIKKTNKQELIIEKEVVITNEKLQKALLSNHNYLTPIYKESKKKNNSDTTINKLVINNSYQSENTDNVIVNTEKIDKRPEHKELFKKQSDSSIVTTTHFENIDSSNTNKVTKKPSKKSKWLFSLGGGILKTSSNYSNKGLVNSSSASIGSSGGFTGVSNNTQPAITSPKTGFSVNIGIAYNTDLGKKWQLQTGLQYQYLTNQHGLKADTTTGFTNSFIADNNNYITNNAHLLQIPFMFTYNLNSTSKHPINLLIGGSLAYVVSEKWLISNTSNGRFYYDASLNNRWLFGAHSGLSYTLSQKLSLAAIASYTLTPVQSKTTDKNHFLQYNFQLSTPISFSKTKKIKK